MGRSDFLTVVVAFSELEKQAYTDILNSVGLPDPTVIEPHKMFFEINALKQAAIAYKIAKIVGDKKAVIIGQKHYNIAFCYNNDDTDLIIFDAHNDSDNTQKGFIREGNFITQRKGLTYILGTGTGTNEQGVYTYSPIWIRRILHQDLAEKIFLSLELDVFNGSVTKAHDWPHSKFIDNFSRYLGIGMHLNYKPVLDISKKLASTKDIVGLNIAGYVPRKDPNHKTADLIKQYLDEVLTVYLQNSEVLKPTG